MQARAEELAGQAHALEGRCAELEMALKAERIRRNDLAAQLGVAEARAATEAARARTAHAEASDLREQVNI